ncbi:adenosylhomocysteinase [Sesbania bispinosa]|nr:adenosylhomocysteinase [Sesbania bispinosa]
MHSHGGARKVTNEGCARRSDAWLRGKLARCSYCGGGSGSCARSGEARVRVAQLGPVVADRCLRMARDGGN